MKGLETGVDGDLMKLRLRLRQGLIVCRRR